MMMPANFTAVNSEVVYGGGVIETLGAYTAPIWNASNVKTFNTNLLTILSNSFVGDLVAGTMGTMFGGYWLDKDYEGKVGYKMFDKESGTLSGQFYHGTTVDADGTVNTTNSSKFTGLNSFMKVLGFAAAAYTLGTTSVKNSISENEITIFG